ncbi:MAG: terminase family protein [Clostridia bacterium]|nr:terminase family protein [Clostridia bacterium]
MSSRYWTPFQEEFWRRRDDPFLIASCGVSSGKTHIGAWWLSRQFVQGKRCLVGCQGFTALSRVMFKEILDILGLLGVRYFYNKTTKEITQVGGEGAIFGYTGENPGGVLGLSEIHALLLDEASYCPEEAYLWAADRLRGQTVSMPLIRLLTSPDNFNSTHSWFIDLVKNNPERVIYGSALDNQFTSAEFKAQLLERYPKGTPLYEQQILGHILNSDLANVILRGMDYPQAPSLDFGNVYFGIDCSGAGRDATVFLVRNDREIIEVRRVTSGQVGDEIQMYEMLADKYHPVGVALDDTGGFARGFSSIEHRMPNLVKVNFGSRDVDRTYANRRTGMYMRFAKKVKEGFYIDRRVYRDIEEQLRFTQYLVNPDGKTALIPKDMIKKQLKGRSPDEADALALSFECKDGRFYDDIVSRIA